MSSNSERQTLSARWVFPVDKLPIENGCVQIEGERIVAIGSKDSIKDQSAPTLYYDQHVIIPGLVNCHTHLDLSGSKLAINPGDPFTQFLSKVIQFRRNLSPAQLEQDYKKGLQQILQSGTTLVGDIHTADIGYPLLNQTPIHSVLFREAIGLPKENARNAWSKLAQWLKDHPSTDRCKIGISPHAPYTVRAYLFRVIASYATIHQLPVAIHLAESPDEEELMLGGESPLAAFLANLGVLAEEGFVKSYAEIAQYYHHVKNVHYVHTNNLYSDDPNFKNAYRVICPRTQRQFGYVGGPIEEIRRGRMPLKRVALGTDSLASNPDLDLFREMQFLYQLRPDCAEEILRMGTLTGAEILQWHKQTGSITPGKYADLLIMPISKREYRSPYRSLLEADDNAKRITYYRGKIRTY